MREARKYIISLLEEMKVRIDSITLSDCEGSFPMMRWIVHSLKCSRNHIGEKNLGRGPFRGCSARPTIKSKLWKF